MVALRPRLITFHGSADATVNPVNSTRLMAAMRGAGAQPVATERRINGRDTVCPRTLAPDGRIMTEDWRIIGAGHAWSGGTAGVSHADPMAPDATALMLAFFLGQPDSI